MIYSYRRPLGLLAAILLLSPFAACSGPASQATTQASATAGQSTAPATSGSSPAASPVCAPGADGSLTPVNFQLNFAPGGYHAGFALALQEGYYKDAGLNVTLIKGTTSGLTAQLVASGQAGLAYSDAMTVMQLIGKGAKIKILSTIYQVGTKSVTALASSGIKTFADLKGKTVGMAVGELTAVIPILLKANNLTENDIKFVTLPGTSLAPALMQHQVDAILGSTDGYNLTLEQNNAGPLVVFPYYKYGVNTISTSIIASDSFLAEHGPIVKCFIQASLKGWDTAIKNPGGAVADLVKTFPNDTTPALASGQLKAAIELMCANGAKSVGEATAQAWQSTVDIGQQVLGLPTNLGPSDYHTNDYLPATMPTQCPIG